MRLRGKINVKTLAGSIAIGIILLISMNLKAFNTSQIIFFNSLTGFSDTIPNNDTLPLATDTVIVKSRKDSSLLAKDTGKLAKNDTLNLSKDSLDAPVSYAAADSGVLLIPSKQFILYGKADAKYKDIELQAAIINYNQQSQLVRAYGLSDTSTDLNAKPKLTQGDSKSISDSILFNLKTMKGRTTNSFFNEGELFVHADVLKKEGKDIFYGYRGRFTTCNLDTPHFAFRTRKLKMIANKLAVSGPASPEFEGVPIPIGIPFGIYPLTTGRHSGILPPQFIVSQDYGLGLENLGYYKVLSDNFDITTRANIYSYGGYSFNINPKYYVRYHYQGALNFSFQSIKALNQNYLTPQEYNTSKSFMLNWTHTRDNKARPGTTFSANVNFGSTKYNQYVLNNPFVNFQNQLSSSISYSKDFGGKSNISVNLNHNQNSNTGLVNLNLPTISYNVNTFYPFQKKEQVGAPKWWESIGIGYTGNFTNQLSFYDSAFSFKRLLDTAQYGFTHNIPITLTLPQLGPVTLSPSVSYQERWYGQKIFRNWDSINNRLDTSIRKGFFAARQMTYGISASTRIFGTYQFKHSSGIQAIRHEIRPTIALNYSPNMNGKFYYSMKVDTFGHVIRFSQFDGVIPGAFPEGAFGGISFGVDNLLEMKVKSKTDTTNNGIKKVKLLDGFGFNSSYNLLADSFALAPFNLYARSTLFEKINITASAILDPYQVDQFGFRKNVFTWNSSHPTLGRLTGANIAISTQFKSKTKDGKTANSQIPVDPFMTPEEQQMQLQYIRNNPAEYTDFNIPWTLSLSYSLNYTKQLHVDSLSRYSFASIFTSNLNFQGDFSLTTKWKVGATGFLDFNAGRLQQLSMYLTREMHCWQMSINVTPIGLWRSFSITLNPKSGILRDLRINRTRMFSNY
ncbi:putative LPS assembly protein LptD [Hydrotalea sandarakina]|jgi:hypothetical protein|uniref:LPS-assembly protein LptD central domain-containing protein n=1 Tax=Hydrotalea sandarakina TaxID=1004304 RepID=A0A2W7SFG4_9BACT|nr:putative LPS assembly protein LptD [Hydrotalea sandarakina]PZX65657.1 hypothetical protein LX80_00146 [Hydrotalea sandarakina]